MPKNEEALHRLDFNQNIEGDLIEMSIDDTIYSNLENTSFFETINRLTGANIDKFEDESITDKEALEKVVSSEIFNEKRYDHSLYSIVRNIKALFEEALKCQTGIFFYF
ncbi:hypothetical protein [Arcticibacter tournemirensis]|uniref:hypothetical protein n=1 Tax=Arcticibacter tournemirensis TaxID=699437 RepID=UPI00123B6A07|nr:hypothetical protein [Arcticibacter tournemirensis]